MDANQDDIALWESAYRSYFEDSSIDDALDTITKTSGWSRVAKAWRGQ